MTRNLTIPSAGVAIRVKRKRLGLSLSDLATRTGLNKGLLSKYENNQVALSIPLINKLAEAFGERPEALACECLKHAYPALANPRTQAAKLLAELISHLETHGKRTT